MSISRAIAVGVVLLVSNCPSAPTACRARDREADARHARGKELLEKKQYEAARAVLEPALAGHTAASDHAAASFDASLLSEVHQKTNQYRDAVLLAEVARVEALASGEGAPLATALIAHGTTLQRIGDRTRALAAYDEAVPLLPASDRAGRARLAIYRALALKAQGRLSAAEKLAEEGRDLALAESAHVLVIGACVTLSDMAIIWGKPDDAAHHLRCARAASRARGDAHPSPMILCNEAHVARLRGDLSAAAAILDQIPPGDSPDTERAMVECRGEIAMAAGQLVQAEAHYTKAVEIVESMRRDVAPADAKAPFLEQRWDAYQNLFALRLGRDDTRGAFETLSRAQGRMFFDALAASLAESGPAASSRVDAAIGRIDTLERVARPLADSRLAAAMTPEQTLAALRGRHVLIYFPAAGRMRLLTLVGGEPRATGVDVDLDELDRLITAFRSEPGDPAAAEALGRALLPPDVLPAPPARLHVIPTGPLLKISFAALRVSGERLLDRYEIVYAPSATGLAAMTTERGDRAGAGAGAVLADARRDLRHAAKELESVVDRTGAIAHVGAGATVAALRSAAHAPLLHVISHSGLGLDGGYLVLADGEVTAADIVAWRIGPQLVVLPTCASAATAGREMWGSLAAAFLAAGSRHVVATVTSVEDAVGAEFTRLFYLAGGARDPVGGVTRAQREMAARHPVAEWSAFVVAGL